MTLAEELELFFSIEFGVSLDEVRKRLERITLANWAWNLKGCLHHLYFAMASLIVNDVKNVLELGTGLGETTAVLSELFPTAKIYTFDVPRSDKSYVSAWRCLERKRDAMGRFLRNIKQENIIFIDRNTFFLSSLKLPEKFEMIWVDGGHKFPAVAWDIMFAYNYLQEGGFMFMHDYSVNPSKQSQVKDVLDYVSSRIKEKIWLLPVSPNPEKNEIAKTVCIRKG